MTKPDREGGTYEMLWNCQYCGTRKLLGLTHRFCPNCGSPQQPDSRYFPSDADRVAVKDHVFTGVDRICPACAAPSSAAAEFCRQCGSPLTDAAKVTQAGREELAEGESFAAGREIRKQSRTGAETAGGDKHESTARRVSRSHLWIMGTIGLLVIGVLAFFFWQTETTAKVVGVAWQNRIQIETYQRVTDSAWCDSRPGDAYDISRRREVRSYRQVEAGETCRRVRMDQGDGTYREVRECTPTYRDEPIYDDKCYYLVNRWRPSRSVVAKGQDKKPHWPSLPRLRTGNCLGCERLGARRSVLSVDFVDADGRRDSCEVDEAVWKRLDIGTPITVKRRVMGGSAVCGSIKRG